MVFCNSKECPKALECKRFIEFGNELDKTSKKPKEDRRDLRVKHDCNESTRFKHQEI